MQSVARLRDKRTKVHEFDPSVMSLSIQDRGVPASSIQALMEAAPHDEPAESIEEREERLEPIRFAIDHCELTERERYVIDALFWRRIGLRAIGAEFATEQKPKGLSHAQIARYRDAALEKIRQFMEEE